MNLKHILRTAAKQTHPVVYLNEQMAKKHEKLNGNEEYTNMCATMAQVLTDEYFIRPLSHEGEPIKLGTTWYGEDGRKWRVVGYNESVYNITIRPEDIPVYLEAGTKPAKSQWMRKEQPDSWESIISAAYKAGEAGNYEAGQHLIDRCEKLAGAK